MDFTQEKDLQNEIANNQSLQRDICGLLDMDFYQTRFHKETKFINGITADFTLFERDKIKALMECKGGAINVTDYVRGIGQIFQYEYFAEKGLSVRDYEFYPLCEFSSVYIFPDSVLRNNEFNIGLFKYPQTKKILEVNSHSLAVRLIDENELLRLEESRLNNLTIISQYYIRDNRLFELYFLLQVLMLLKIKKKKVHRFTLHGENGFLRKTNTINNANWRNAFISLSSLGFIDRDNYPTQIGLTYANKPFYEFAYMLFTSYLRPFYEAIFAVLPHNLNESNQVLCTKLREHFNCKNDVLFLTQSNGRYISSWLNIARDDFGIIDFTPRSNERKILFNPCVSSEMAFKEHIAKHSKWNDFEAKFMELCDEI